MRWSALLGTCVLFFNSLAVFADGNRLVYLEENNPYYVGRGFPRLITPQWIGEEGVEAVVILAIDDMRDHKKYEVFLRPILNRLKRLDGRAPVSIMTNRLDPNEPHLQKWLKEGVSLETHTYDHPCPLLQKGDFAKAKETYDRCVDLLCQVPNSKPVAFRMPCCDSLNTPSPRFYAEIFNKRTPNQNFLALDTSVFNIFTSDDPDLPRQLVIDSDGRDKFLKYIPRGRSFVNTIENYPYPYVINRLCWEFPCVVPSDWEAQFLHKPNNPITVRDWKAALDATVLKQGVFCLVFHPHNWIRNDQIVDFIDYAEQKHGKKVKFLTFREAYDRLNKNLLVGHTLRAADGNDHGIRLLDVNDDGYLDVVIGAKNKEDSKLPPPQTRIWLPEKRSWQTVPLPFSLWHHQTGLRTGCFGVIEGKTCFLYRHQAEAGAWQFVDGKWVEAKELLNGLQSDGHLIVSQIDSMDAGARLRDLDRDGTCEFIIGNPKQQAVFRWSPKKKTWQKLPFALPKGTTIVDAKGRDAGLRFVDVNEDGFDDVLFSNEHYYSLHLFASLEAGWSKQLMAGKQGEPNALPMFVRNGTDNGAWFHSRHLWVQNEDTALLPNLVDRRSFNTLLANDEMPPPKSPTASLKSIRTRPGFRVELVACEPLVQDPIAFAWGPDGKFWVVEMGDYPLGVDGKGKPGGRVKFLEDTDGDGQYDKATVFLDQLGFPTGVMPWKKGVLVTCAPDIFYAEDTNGDGKADRREVLYTGFGQGNQQHRVNGLVWGLDNWIYCANGDSGGVVRSLRKNKNVPPVNISGRDFRIRPETGDIDLQSGQTQFGRNRDDWGNWFGGNNSNPMWHFVLADHYLRRNPHLAAPVPRVPVSVTPGAARIYPISRTLARFNNPQSANHFTSACSPIVYRDDLFGPHFLGNAFVCEPVHNLIHREIMTPDGVSFSSRRAEDELESEFLASSDHWFRPTMIQTGPDGALWIADMYRFVIEHPQWIPKRMQERLDLRAGHDKGRIYRVIPIGKKPRPIPLLHRLPTADLVRALDSANGWQRDMAQQLLVEKNDKAAIPLLEQQATRSQRPLCRLHSLCTLDGMNALRASILIQALKDQHAGVRRHALRLSEKLFNKSPELAAAVLQLANDPDPFVRMQLAYSLGEWKDPKAGEVLGKLALKAANDSYLLAAVLSSVHDRNLDNVLLAVIGTGSKPPPGLLDSLLRLANAFQNHDALGSLLSHVTAARKDTYEAWQLAALANLLDSLDQRGTSLAALQKSKNEKLLKALQRTQALFSAARDIVDNSKAGKPLRLAAIRILGRGPTEQKEDLARLARFLPAQADGDLQSAAIEQLGSLKDPTVPKLLLEHWRSYAPGRRSQVLDVLFSRQDWLKAVLDAVENKAIAVSELDATRRQRLLEHKDASIRKRAAKLLADAVNPDRQKVIEAYRSVLTLEGKKDRGAKVFAKHCASCHRLGDVGHQVGADLTALADKSPQALLIAVLDPNRAVESKFMNYTAVTINGVSVTGVLVSETGNSITLVAAEGKKHTILRRDLDELISTGRSAMPEGLEKEIDPQAMADLFAYIRSVGPKPQAKSFAGNKPELVKPNKDGTLLLSARNCEIYGQSLVYEQKYGNLGYWNSDDDRAVWEADVPRTGRYEIILHWAIPNHLAGKRFVLRAGANEFVGRVEGTGGWDHYRRQKVGEMILNAGRQRLTFRALGKLNSSPLLDLKDITLKPAAGRQRQE
ncbi:MAG: hypothetical protein KatS3mg105_3219 [Gemmatales bacterium]|nr:MAG: hypothetical protein KatS3mg105_3219 [Gemmatales bacterium]